VVAPCRPVDESEWVNIVTDWETAAYEATSHLLELGHQRIALIMSQYHTDSRIKLRMTGYKKALLEKDLYADGIQDECRSKDFRMKK